MSRSHEHTHLFVTAVFPMVVREKIEENVLVDKPVEQICGACDTVILEGQTTPIAVHPIIRGEMPIVFEREPSEDTNTPLAA